MDNLEIGLQMKTSTIKKTYFILGIIAIGLLWFILSLSINNENVIPSIPKVAISLVDILKVGNSYIMILSTILKLIGTVIISLVIAALLASLSLLSTRFTYFLKPLIIIMRTLPVAAMIMILLVVFFRQNVRYQGTMVVSSFVIIPVMYEGILAGFKGIDKSIKDEVKLISNSNIKTIYYINLPLALPYIFVSIIQSLGLGLKVMIMSEVIMLPTNSIGKAISEYASWGELDDVFAWSIILLILVVLFDILLKHIRNKIKGALI